MLLLLSSLSLSAGVSSMYLHEKDADETAVEKRTPVYEGDIDHQVGILEEDYPELAARFAKDYPDASGQLWIKENRSLFVYFINNGFKVSAVYTSKGSMLYAVSLIDSTAVPDQMWQQIKKDYPSFLFFNARKIEAGGSIMYELVFENNEAYIVLSTTDNNEIVLTNKLRKTLSHANGPIVP